MRIFPSALIVIGLLGVAKYFGLIPIGMFHLIGPILLIVLALVAYIFVLPRILVALVGLPLVVKFVVSGVLLAPIGFLMGMPFPTGLRALENTEAGAIEWAWAMNAAASVLGSVLAMVIAVHFGLAVTLACGAVAYLGAMMMVRSLQRGTVVAQ